MSNEIKMKIGDKAYHLLSGDKGNWGLKSGVLHFTLVEIIDSTDKSWKYRYLNESFSETKGHYVDKNFLIERQEVESKSIKIINRNKNLEINIIPESVVVKKTDKGDFYIKAFIIENESYGEIAVFIGQQKLKKAKGLESIIKAADAKSIIEI